MCRLRAAVQAVWRCRLCVAVQAACGGAECYHTYLVKCDNTLVQNSTERRPLLGSSPVLWASATSFGAPIAIAEWRRWLSVEHDAQ